MRAQALISLVIDRLSSQYSFQYLNNFCCRWTVPFRCWRQTLLSFSNLTYISTIFASWWSNLNRKYMFNPLRWHFGLAGSAILQHHCLFWSAEQRQSNLLAATSCFRSMSCVRMMSAPGALTWLLVLQVAQTQSRYWLKAGMGVRATFDSNGESCHEQSTQSEGPTAEDNAIRIGPSGKRSHDVTLQVTLGSRFPQGGFKVGDHSLNSWACRQYFHYLA